MESNSNFLSHFKNLIPINYKSLTPIKYWNQIQNFNLQRKIEQDNDQISNTH